MEFGSDYPPQFALDHSGKPTKVTLDVKTYIALLVRANVTDLTLWPPGAQEGATALARVRQIESNCTEQHGEFDWEKLPAAIQDEYDNLCVLLDRFQDADGRVTWEEYKAKHEELRG